MDRNWNQEKQLIVSVFILNNHALDTITWEVTKPQYSRNFMVENKIKKRSMTELQPAWSMVDGDHYFIKQFNLQKKKKKNRRRLKYLYGMLFLVHHVLSDFIFFFIHLKERWVQKRIGATLNKRRFSHNPDFTIKKLNTNFFLNHLNLTCSFRKLVVHLSGAYLW